MLAPLKWLADYVDIRLPDKEIAYRLTMAGLEVTHIERTGESWEDIAVGKVLNVERHPNADRLTLVTVDVGGGERYKVICGAPNVAAGQKIAYAKLGAHLIVGWVGLKLLLDVTLKGLPTWTEPIFWAGIIASFAFGFFKKPFSK